MNQKYVLPLRRKKMQASNLGLTGIDSRARFLVSMPCQLYYTRKTWI